MLKKQIPSYLTLSIAGESTMIYDKLSSKYANLSFTDSHVKISAFPFKIPMIFYAIIFIFIFLSLISFKGFSQTIDSIKVGQVTVVADERIESLSKLYAKPIIPEGPLLIKGYRVQLGISQSRDQLSAERDKFNKSFPDIRTYLNYEQPNFKLRAGDFKSKAEASTFMYSIRKQYPGCFLVEDIVEIKIQKSNEE